MAIQDDDAPIVIFGSGGSGTRAFAAFARNADITLGHKLNHALDDLSFVEALDRWAGETRLSMGQAPDHLVREAAAALRSSALAITTDARQDRMWGFKNPRHILILPALLRAFPNCTLIHVVRDVRDLVFSRNRNQYRRYAHHWLDCAPDPAEESPSAVLARARFWALTNLNARRLGLLYAEDRYHAFRLEAMHGAAGENERRRLCAALGRQPEKGYADTFEEPSGLGRWQKQPEEGLKAMLEDHDVSRAMRAFGYI